MHHSPRVQFPYQVKATGNGSDHIVSLRTAAQTLEHAIEIAGFYMNQGWALKVLVFDQRTGQVCWRESWDD